MKMIMARVNVEIVKRPDQAKGFTVLPKRWAEHPHSRARSPKVPRAFARGMAVEGVE
jgi:hypothetical protein